MKYFMNLLWWCFSLLITTKCEGEPIHYKSYHFEWNNPEQWSSVHNMINTKNDNNMEEIISCTIDIPSLCIYAIPQKPGFQLFYKHLMFDFLNDQNWTQIIVTNNFDIDDIKQQHQNQNISDIDTQNNNKKKPQRRRLRRRRCGRRCRRRRARRARLRARRRRITRRRRRRHRRSKRHCNYRCRIRRAYYRSRRRAKREQRMRRTVYGGLYRFGQMLGKSMKRNNFYGIDQRSMQQKMMDRMKRLRGGCGNQKMRAQCPTRFATYLGPPHIVGKPSYIVGTPPVGYIIPQFGMGRMGGMMGMGGMGGMRGMGMSRCGRGRRGKKCRNRRRLINGGGGSVDRYNYGNDVRLEKCVDIKDTEKVILCVTYYYYDRSISLDYNVVERNDNDDRIYDDNDDKIVEYIKSNIWIWNGNDVNLIECDINLLSFIGYTVCMEQMENDDNDEMYVLIMDDMDNPPVYKLNLMKQEKWDKMYEMNDVENHKKICKYILQIEICFAFKIGDKKIEITTQRILSE